MNNDPSLESFLTSMCEKLEYRSNGDLYWTEQDHRKDLIGKKAGSVSSSDGYVYIKFKQRRIRRKTGNWLES